MSAAPVLRYYPNRDWMTRLARNKFIEKNVPNRAKKSIIGRFAHPKDRIRYWNVTVGDTVQIAVGRHKGKVATVTYTDKERNMIKLDQHEVNKKWIKAPDEDGKGEHSEQAYRPRPIHVSNVRVKLGDRPLPGGGSEEVFAKRVERRQLWFNVKRKQYSWIRVAPTSQEKLHGRPGEGEIVPWPNPPPKKPAPEPTVLDTTADTMTKVQEKFAYRPDLESHPFPDSSLLSLEEAFARLRPAEWSEKVMSGEPLSTQIKTTRNGRPIPLGLFSDRERSLYAPLAGNQAIRYSVISDELRNAWSRARRTKLWNEAHRQGHYEAKKARLIRLGLKKPPHVKRSATLFEDAPRASFSEIPRDA